MQQIVSLILLGTFSTLVGMEKSTQSSSSTSNIQPSSSSYYVGVTSGKTLKTPGEIIQEIEKFSTSVPSSASIPGFLLKESAQLSIASMHTLLNNAYFAYYMCDRYLTDSSSKRRKTKAHISHTQEWKYDPMRYKIFYQENPNASSDDYEKYLREESQKLMWDLQHCKEYKETLSYHIKSLIPSILYYKSSHGEDQIAAVEVKAAQDLKQKQQE